MDIPNLNKSKIIIIGSGNTLAEYHDSIENFIRDKKCVSIGINNMTNFIIPDYHLWTNKKQFSIFAGNSIKKKSRLLLGCGIHKKLVNKYYNGKYERIDYKDDDEININKNLIKGHYRTAGVLAIAIAYLMKAKKIYIVGMDGYTLYSKKGIKHGKNSQHCYGKGHTDEGTWEEGKKKDDLVNQNLEDLWEYGVRFSILTPTKFKKFSDPSILGI